MLTILFHFLSPAIAALLCFRPVFSGTRGLEHHLHLHPVPASQRRGLYHCLTQKLPNPSQIGSGSTPACLLHIPPHRSQIPLHLQPARPLQHIPGDSYGEGKKSQSPWAFKCKLRLICSQLSGKKGKLNEDFVCFSPKWRVGYCNSSLPDLTALLPTWSGENQGSVTNFSSKLLLV